MVRLPRHQSMAKIMRKNWRSCDTSWTKLVRSSISRIAMGETIRRSFIGTWKGENSELGMHVRSLGTRVISVNICGWHQNGWKEAEHGSYGSELMKKCGHWRTHIMSWPCVLGMHSAGMQAGCNNLWPVYKEHVWITFFCWSNRNLLAETSRTNSSVVLRHGGTCSKMCRCCELANKKVEQFYKVSSPCLDDHQFKQEELESVGELSEVCSQIVLKCLYLARIGRPDILWSVNKLARSVTKWTQACDKRLARLISWYSSHARTIVNIVIWETHHGIAALQTWFIPRFRLCWRPWGLKINLRWCLVYSWEV